MTFETTRLLLRPWCESDAESCYRYARDPFVGTAAGWPEIGSEPEIGYWIGRPLWGQGLIPEAVRELLRYCFEDKDAQRVWCSHYAGNEKSKRVIEKCGFSYQLTCERPALVDDALRPTLFYALTKEKWEKTR